MQRFVTLFQVLDQTTSTNSKVEAIANYLAESSPADAAWAVYFLSGRRLKRLIGHATLKQWLVDEVDLPQWLIEDTYDSVGDLAETIALLSDLDTVANETTTSLTQWITELLLPLRDREPAEQRAAVTKWWAELPYAQNFVVNKLLTGALRIGVSQTLVARAIALHAGLPKATILHRMMGEWEPTAEFYLQLIGEDDGSAAISRPYPFCLAAGLEQLPEALGARTDWQAEWKWDGIRAQIVRRANQCFIWSRGEELIGERFPEIQTAADSLTDGTVLDGEILAWDSNHGVMEFAQLQRRIGRKSVGKKLLSEVPCVFLAYDLLEFEANDIRNLPLQQRRSLLEQLDFSHLPQLRLSPVLKESAWDELACSRAQSRERRVEGLMLKQIDSVYGTGRQRGLWWKWKVEPYTLDAVMLYAQAGHGRRSNLYTDYTFGVWSEKELVPLAKAYSGLTDVEIRELDRWIRKNTIERFGPVRSVERLQVFELAFEGISKSTRHKSGIAVRFPRIVRWRQDLAAKDADSLSDVIKLINDA